jgi:penicillin-binding protein 1B
VARPASPKASRTSARPSSGRRRWLWYALAALAIPLIVLTGVLSYYYVAFSRQIETRLHGERDRVLPRVFARPLELHRGQSLTDRQLVDRLNDLGYAQRGRVERPGEFAIGQGAIALVPRGGDRQGSTVRIVFDRPGVQKAAKGASTPGRIAGVTADGRSVEGITLDPPLLTALMSTGREKRRQVPLAAIPPRVVQAVIAIEDRRFYDHPGIDPIRIVGALLSNMRGSKRYLEGASTLTQQLARNFFLTEQLAQEAASGRRSPRRKLLEQFMAIILERQASKDEILELYLNEVYLGQRGSFAIHGVAEAARLMFGKDVSNVSMAEAATIAGIIQSPSVLSPFHAPVRCRDRRNVVLRAMADAGFISEDAAGRAASEPLTVVRRALESQAPYFVDIVGQALGEQFPGITASSKGLDVYTTLDVHLQRIAQDAVRTGIVRLDELLARRKRQRQAQAALIAVDPKTGDVLALVGGRSYNESQYNRAVSAHRQPGSVFKPFVYLAAFERAADEGRNDLTPATIVDDEPTSFEFAQQVWNPSNYENEYDGMITLRRALAMSRNIATIHVAELAGFDRVAALWRRIGVGAQPHAYPSITLGVFEASPFEIATAYTLFPNGGELTPLREREASGSMRPASRGRPTTCAMPGSSASRRSCSRSSGWAWTTTSRSASVDRRPRCPCGPSSWSGRSPDMPTSGSRNPTASRGSRSTAIRDGSPRPGVPGSCAKRSSRAASRPSCATCTSSERECDGRDSRARVRESGRRAALECRWPERVKPRPP